MSKSMFHLLKEDNKCTKKSFSKIHTHTHTHTTRDKKKTTKKKKKKKKKQTNIRQLRKSKTKVANHELFYTAEMCSLSTSELERMRHALKSDDFR